MKQFVWGLLAGLILLALPAHAADPGVCRPFAAVSSQLLVRYAWLRLYTHCLQLEQDYATPLLNWQEALAIVDPDKTPVWPLDREDVAAIQSLGNVPATDRPLEAAPEPPRKKTTDWQAKCARSHPRGYDKATGTYRIVSRGKWIATPCPRGG